MDHPRLPRTRRGLGLFPILLMGLGIVFIVSVLRGNRGGGYYGRPAYGMPFAPEASAEATVSPGEAPAAPLDAELAALHKRVMDAKGALQGTLSSGDPARIAAARDTLASAQRDLDARLAASKG